MIVREIVNRILFDVVNQRDLDRANDAVDRSVDNAQDATRATEGQTRSIDRLGRSLRASTGLLGGFSRGLLGIGRNIVTIGGLGGLLSIGGLTAFGISSLNVAGQVEESRDRMAVALGDIAEEQEGQLRRTSTLLGVNRNQFRDFFTDFALQLEQSVGIDRSAELAQELTERLFDLESFRDIDADQIFAAFRSGINGSSEPLERFNVNIRQSAVDAFILSEGLASNSREIDENIRRYARLQLILNQTENAQGNLVDTSDSFTNTLRRTASSFAELRAEIGTRFLPIAQQVLDRVNTCLLYTSPSPRDLSTSRMPSSA